MLSSKILGSAFINPGTSFQILTSLALRIFARIAAVKSEPSLPSVVVFPVESDPMNPSVNTNSPVFKTGNTKARTFSLVFSQSTLADVYYRLLK